MKLFLLLFILVLPGTVAAAPLGVWNGFDDFGWVVDGGTPDLDSVQFSFAVHDTSTSPPTRFLVLEGLAPGVANLGITFRATSSTDPGFDAVANLLLDPTSVVFPFIVVPGLFEVGEAFDSGSFDPVEAAEVGIVAITLRLDRLDFEERPCSFCGEGQTLYRVFWEVTATAVPEPSIHSMIASVWSLLMLALLPGRLACRHTAATSIDDES